MVARERGQSNGTLCTSTCVSGMRIAPGPICRIGTPGVAQSPGPRKFSGFSIGGNNVPLRMRVELVEAAA